MKVSELQKGNAVIKYIKRINIEYRYSIYDYEPGEYFGLIHITLQLHMHSPQYVFGRIERIKSSQTKRVPILLLLINIDITTPSAAAAFSKLQTDCVSLSVQIVPANSPAECAKYIENMHHQKNEPEYLRNHKSTIQKARRELPGTLTELDIHKHLFVTAISKIRSTDAINLLSNRTIKEIAESTVEQITKMHKGIGQFKADSLREFFMHKFN